MADFGSLAPNSQVVQTDEEYLAPFWGALRKAQQPLYSPEEIDAAKFLPSNMANTLGNQYADWLNPTGIGSGINTTLGNQIYGKILNGTLNPTQYANFAQATGYTGPAPDAIRNYDVTGAQRAMAGGNYNPEAVAAAQSDLDNAMAARTEANQRQTSAYGQMQGGNFFGGMLSEGYSDPSGGTPAKTGGLGGLGGMPNGDYNSWGMTWQPEQRQFNSGSWGTPFKW